jgi:aryl sulfotransferase
MIWIASFPRSGNTWMRILLSAIVAPDTSPPDINALTSPGELASSRSLFEDLTLLDSRLLRPDEIDRLRPAVHEALPAQSRAELFIKSHEAFTYLADGTPLLGRSARAALYLARDPRDVAVSLRHFFGGDQHQAMALLNDAGSRLGTGDGSHLERRLNGWSGHVRSWLDQTTVPTCVVRYEDLLADTPAAVSRVVDYLDLAATDADVHRATRHASFGELQRQEQQRGFREKPTSAAVFFRGGRAGAWSEELSATAAREIERVHGEMMSRLGYL